MEHSDHYSKALGNVWHCYRDEPVLVLILLVMVIVTHLILGKK